MLKELIVHFALNLEKNTVFATPESMDTSPFKAGDMKTPKSTTIYSSYPRARRAAMLALSLYPWLLTPPVFAQGKLLSLNGAFDMGDITSVKRFTGAVRTGRQNLWRLNLPTNSDRFTMTLAGMDDYVEAKLYSDANGDGQLQENEVVVRCDRNYPSVTSDLEAGIYYIVGSGGAQPSRYQLTLATTPRPAQPAQAPGEVQQALDIGMLGDPKNATGFVGKTHPRGVYRFEAPSNLKDFSMTISGLNNNIEVSLYRDANGDSQLQPQEKLTEINRNTTSTTTDLETGVYLVSVDRFRDDNTNYRLTLAGTPKPAMPKAAPGLDPAGALDLGAITRPINVVGFVGKTRLAAVYQLRLTKPGGLTLTLSEISKNLEVGLFLDRNKDGQLQDNERLLGITGYEGRGTTSGAAPRLSPGTYFVKVDAGRENSVYRLTLAP